MPGAPRDCSGEAALIAEAEQDLAEGRFISGAELELFLNWFVSGVGGPGPLRKLQVQRR